MRIIQERNRREDEQEFQRFCEELLSLPPNLELRPKQNFVADIELQPHRWLGLGIDLLQSRRVTAYGQLANGIQGPPMTSYLPYPVFQIATEIFLKGMWLCQYSECRALTDSSYLNLERRQWYLDRLGSKKLSHDLLRIIEDVRQIAEYERTPSIMRFLNLVEKIVRRYYFPPYDADKQTRWADSRYPKRVYDDLAQTAFAESFASYPEAKWIEKLFRQTEKDIDALWDLRVGLMRQRGIKPHADS